MKVFWLFNHPAPYKVDFFNELGKEVELDVYFERASEKSRNRTFYSESPLSFSCHICSSFCWGEGNNYTREPIKALKKNHYDIIVLNGWRTLTEQRAIAFCKRHHLDYVFWINGGIIKSNESSLVRKIKKHYIKGASSYFSPDSNSSAYLVHYGADKDKIIIYPYSSIYEKDLVTAPLSKESKLALRKKLGLKGERIFISVGQFIERKNYKELISLFAKMDKEDVLYIMGEGSQKEEYEKLIDSLGLVNVHLLPYKPHNEVLEYFRAADCFVFFSKEDIYGHVVNEALSQALPVVSSKSVNAATHLLNNGENGFLIDLGNEEQIIGFLRLFPNKDMENGALKKATENTMEESSRFVSNAFKAMMEGKANK
jgi:glycosyltransferase involved in cell wall biosynthesis